MPCLKITNAYDIYILLECLGVAASYTNYSFFFVDVTTEYSDTTTDDVSKSVFTSMDMSSDANVIKKLGTNHQSNRPKMFDLWPQWSISYYS
jgi:hypothetical protein